MNEDMPNINLDNQEETQKLVKKVKEKGEPIVVQLEDKNGNIAIGVAVPKNQPDSITYLTNIRDYNNTEADIYKQIELCRKLYVWEGVIGTVIDMFIDLSYSDIKVEGIENNQRAQKLFKFFLSNINKGNNNIATGINALTRALALEYYVTGNTFIYSKWKKTMVNTLKGKYNLPLSMVTLDPKIIEIPKDSVQFGSKIIKISVNRLFNIKERLTFNTNNLTRFMPVKIRRSIEQNKDIELDPYYVYHIKRKGSMYSGWGIPYLTRVFGAVASKKKLRVLDDSTIDGMINSITIFKIGDPNYPETWTQERLDAFVNLIRNPHPSMMLAWSWDIDSIHIGPNGEVLNFSDRYKDANNDILYALGVPVALLTGQGERAGDVWASILFLLERLEEFRHEYKNLLEDQLQKILDQNNIDYEDPPRIRFIKPKVNKDNIKTIVLSYYQLGLISKTTALEEAGYDVEAEVSRRQKEKKEKIDDILINPSVPYSPTPNKLGQPNKKTPKENDKKLSKENTVNQKTKQPTPRLQGNKRDRALAIFEFVLEDLDDITMAEGILNNFAENIYNVDAEFDIADMVGLSKEAFLKLVNHSVTNAETKEDIYRQLETYFQ